MADHKVAATLGKQKRKTNPNSLANLRPAWKPGDVPNPNGRPKGARNKLGEAFLEDMLQAWSEKGKAAIDRVIAERPHEFIKAVAGILPKEIAVTTTAVQELSDDELTAALIALRSTLAAANAGNGSEEASRH